MCSKMLLRLRVTKSLRDTEPMEEAPPFLVMNVLIVDKYGLMSGKLLERMQCCMTIFYGPSKGLLIVFSGSVSQLQPVGSGARIWTSQRFEKLLSSSTPLFVNR